MLKNSSEDFSGEAATGDEAAADWKRQTAAAAARGRTAEATGACEGLQLLRLRQGRQPDAAREASLASPRGASERLF